MEIAESRASVELISKDLDVLIRLRERIEESGSAAYWNKNTDVINEGLKPLIEALVDHMCLIAPRGGQRAKL